MNLLWLEITKQMMCRYFTPCRPCFYHPHKMSQIKDVVLHSAWSLFMAVFILWEETSISAIWPKQSKPQHWCAWSFDHRRGGPTFATARRTFIESVHLDVWYCRLPGVLLEARSMHGLAMAWDFCGSRNAFWRDTMKSRRRSARLSRKRCLYIYHDCQFPFYSVSTQLRVGESTEQDFEPFTCKILMTY